MNSGCQAQGRHLERLSSPVTVASEEFLLFTEVMSAASFPVALITTLVVLGRQAYSGSCLGSTVAENLGARSLRQLGTLYSVRKQSNKSVSAATR